MARMNKRELCEKWAEVSRKDDVDHVGGARAALGQCRLCLASAQEDTEVEQARYRYLAQRISDNFWAHNVAHRTKETPGYPGHHGCRVRLRGRKLEMYWYYNEFYKKKKGGGKGVISTHISKEGRHRYHKTAFARAQGWEKSVIEETESGFELIRNLNANLTQVRRLMKTNTRLLDALEQQLASMTKP